MRRNETMRPFICGVKGEIKCAGFLNPVTGYFEKCCEIKSEIDIDHFLSQYDLTSVCISNLKVPQTVTVGV